MSIKRRLMLLIIFLLVFPMLSLMFISQLVLDRQIKNSARHYLVNASKVAQSVMLSRVEKMEKAAAVMVMTEDFLSAVREKDSKKVAQKISELQEINDFTDYIILLDSNNSLFYSYPETLSPQISEFSRLLGDARKNKKSVIAHQAIVLENLFVPGTEDYKKFEVRLQQKEGVFKYVHSLTAAVPIFEKNGTYLGALLIGDITNNDSFLPKRYSWYIKDSYLSLSLYDVRVTSNIKSNRKTNFVGSLVPVKVDTLEGEQDYYFGQVRIDDEIHFFLDCPLYGDEGKIIGALGVGIPEKKFNILQKVNSNIIIVQTLILLGIMLIVGKFMADNISKPILEAARWAEKIASGERELSIKERFLYNSCSEAILLLKNLQKMSNELYIREEEKKNFIERLREEHQKQTELSQQLKELNNELETKVKMRTQELEEAIKILRKADQVKTRFLANMSHELRTPLNVIITSAQALEEGIFGELNERQHKYIVNINTAAQHLLHLINDILDIAKIQAGKMTLVLGVFSVCDLITGSIEEIRSWAESKKIDISCSWLADDFLVMVDRQKFKQILYNLLSNAIKFTPERGKIEIKLWREENFYWIAVKDNGIGIPEAYLNRVFEEFEQIDNSYAREYGGTGLGLPLTKKLVELHGGEIFLFSREGEGTEVVIKMPIALAGTFLSGGEVV